ncbi:MAG: PAS domain-containing protein [candidate division WOR-3 bacterium]|jgi:PAS domain S-box-containing protein
MIFPKAPDPKKLLEEQEAFQEAERRRAEARAQAIFDSLIAFSPVAIELFDLQGNLVKSNRAAERLLGKIPPHGITLNDEKGLKRTGLLEPQLKRLLAGARIETPPYWYDPAEIGLPPTPNGKVYLRVTAVPLLDFEGSVRMLAVIYEDLTELKKAEQTIQELSSTPASAVVVETAPDTAGPDARDVEFARRKIEQAWRESEERYRALVDSVSGACIIRRSEEGNIIAISPSVQDLFGVSREVVMTNSSALYSLIHPEDLPRVQQADQEAKKTGAYPPGLRFRVIKKPADEIVWLEMKGKVCTFASRRTFEILIVDITSEKQLEELLRKKERDLAAIAESPNDGVFLLNRDWVITAWSKGAEKETRVSPQEAVGKKLWEVYPRAEESGWAAPIRKTLLDHQPQFAEFFYQDGRERYAGWFALSTYPLDNGVFGIIRNITSRQKIEQAFQDADRRLRTILSNERVLIAIKDTSLRYIQANQAALNIYAGGTSIIGKSDAELFPAAVTALVGSQDRQVLNTGKPVTLELCLGDPKSATSRWVCLTKMPLPGPTGEPAGIVDIGFDITRLVQAQTELQRRREQFEKLIIEQTESLRRAHDELRRWSGQQ